ncbi:RimK family alpha-L-glutamate ligase [Pseudomonas sp. SID14000]|uniref:ATP-grasp domain-containing protein n=1 Tax=Pseudomonas sp. SID14000 TaxID=1986221 RepID=UPI001C44E543|nr:ATP-grasp domain-containing protein [Pseudomonas sp. SID14000]
MSTSARSRRSVVLWMYENDNGFIPRQQLCELLEEKGFVVFSDFDMRKCHVISGKVYTACGRCLSEFDALFHMNADEQSPYQADILRALQDSGVAVVNECFSFFNCRDKFKANQLLRLHGVNVPDSALLGAQVDHAVIHQLFARWGSLVYKPRSGHGAVGVIRFGTAEQFVDFIQATSHFLGDYYVEQFIEFGDYDCRVEIFNGEVMGGYSRKKKHSFKTNISAGGEMTPRDLGEEVEVALKAAQVLGINGTIVDMVQSTADGQFYVLEVNPLLGIFVESAMRAGTKMPDTEPDERYSYDRLKLSSIASYIDALPARPALIQTV